jgi:hypothetical protein
VADNRAKFWFALFVLVVFCLGGAGGFLLGRHVPPFPRPDGPPPPFGPGPGGRRGGPFGGPGGMPPPVAARLADEVQMDDAQRAQLRQTLEEHRPKFEQIGRDARERFEKEQQELHDAIRAFLRADQVQRFDQFMGRRPR